MKRILIPFLLILTFSLFASKNELLSKEQLQKIPFTTYYFTYNDFSEDSNSEHLWKKFLLENNYELVYDFDKADKALNISKIERKSERRWFQFTTKNDILIVIEIIDMKSGKIELVEEFATNETTKHSSLKPKWYDPIMMTAIVGGLAYLFYYGNQ